MVSGAPKTLSFHTMCAVPAASTSRSGRVPLADSSSGGGAVGGLTAIFLATPRSPGERSAGAAAACAASAPTRARTIAMTRARRGVTRGRP